MVSAWPAWGREACRPSFRYLALSRGHFVGSFCWVILFWAYTIHTARARCLGELLVIALSWFGPGRTNAFDIERHINGAGFFEG